VTRRNLLDLSVVLALAQPGTERNRKAREWVDSVGSLACRICSLTERDFVRVFSDPTVRPQPDGLLLATAILQFWKGLSVYPRWPMPTELSWADLTQPFAARIYGHQQVTDAYLLGLAIKEDGVLVTFDRGIKYLAGEEFRRNVLILE
jgi:predicted nucleic acid-binding protein